MSEPRSTSYHVYLRLNELLGCQQPPDFDADDPAVTRDPAEHEELLFIVTHQAMELWFKMTIADLERARDLLGRPGAPGERVPEQDIPRVCTLMQRSVRTFRLLADHFGVLETMSPSSFLAFRDRLVSGSGFQSTQFRELEILAGLPETERVEFDGMPYLAHMHDDTRGRIEKRLGEMTLRGALFDWLARTPVDDAFPGFVDHFLAAYDRYVERQLELQRQNPNLPQEQLEDIRLRFERSREDARRFFLPENDAKNDSVGQAHTAFVFISTYRHEPLLRWPYALLERVLEFEEQFRVFRFRHARMVERMIGLRPGTGGSAGVDYLDRTSRYRIFGDLLRATSFLMKDSELGAIPKPEILRFAIDRT